MLCAIIVTFNPDISLLLRNTNSLKHSVDKIFIIDNTPNPIVLLEIKNEHSIELISLGKNLGIAKAQNIGIQHAIERGCDKFIFLDQDSSISSDSIRLLLNEKETIEQAGIKIAAIGPTFIDIKSGEQSKGIVHNFLKLKRIDISRHKTPVKVDYIISSGSLIEKNAIDDIGFMDDRLFIDWVDIEWGLRAKSKGYSIFQSPNAEMHHSIGDRSIKILNRSFNIHNRTRNYYIIRNATYLLRKKHMGTSWRSITLFKIPLYLMFYTLTDKAPQLAFNVLVRGVYHGLTGKIGEIPCNLRDICNK